MHSFLFSISLNFFFFLMIRRPPRSTLFPYHDALPIFVDRPPVRRLLLAQLLLARLDEEIRDVEDALVTLLLEEREQLGAVRPVAGVAGAQVLGEDLEHLDLPGQEARCGKLRDEAAAGVAAEIDVRIAVLGVGDVADPALHRGVDVGREARPLALRDAERAADMLDPGADARRHDLGERPGELVAKGAPRARVAQKHASAHVPLDAP